MNANWHVLFVHIYAQHTALVTLALLLVIISSHLIEPHKSHIILGPVQLGRFIDWFYPVNNKIIIDKKNIRKLGRYEEE